MPSDTISTKGSGTRAAQCCLVSVIACLLAACTGGAAYSAALCDFIVQVEKTSHVFITGPAVIKEVTGEEVSFEELVQMMVNADLKQLSKEIS